MPGRDQYDQPPIADYALIGDTRGAALVSRALSVDWLCAPRFDSPPLFSRLIDAEHGGSFSLEIDGARDVTRRYVGDSAVLESIVRTPGGSARVTDGMVVDVTGALLPSSMLVRVIEAGGADAHVRMRFDPRRGIPGTRPRARRIGDALVCSWGGSAIALQSRPRVPLRADAPFEATVPRGAALVLVAGSADRAPAMLVDPSDARRMLERTREWWQAWSDGIDYQGPNRGAVIRSLLTLRLLTYSPSGAAVAAPTTSLPEALGGVRNWDYRFVWPRDMAIGVSAFLAVHKPEEARAFFAWLLHASRLKLPRLSVLSTLDGRPSPPERAHDDVSGYRGSRPVRVGNAASVQHQLDVYGWVVDAAWALARRGRWHSHATFRILARFTDHVARVWREPDAGIWEQRGVMQHYVHSKMMAWLALDRMLLMAKDHRLRDARRARWVEARDALADEIRDRGFDIASGAYVRAYGETALDAAHLLLPVMEFDRDPKRVEGTIDAIARDLSAGDALLYRYPPETDGLPGREGAFLPCTFWMIQALVRLGRIEHARAMFDTACGYGNDVGLFSEEMDPASGRMLGNFPQALTHAAVVQAALALDRAVSAA